MRIPSFTTLAFCGAVVWAVPGSAAAQSGAEDCTVEVAEGWTWFGRCIDRRPHGRGELVSDEGHWAEGAFLDGRQHGYWTVQRADGNVERGPYVAGRRHGAWTVHRSDGTVERGPFVEGERHGRWTVTLPDGRTLSRDWRYDEPLGDPFEAPAERESLFEPRSGRGDDFGLDSDALDNRRRGRSTAESPWYEAVAADDRRRVAAPAPRPGENRRTRPARRPAAGTRPMTNADVREMARAGSAPEDIVRRIENSATDFDTSIDALMALSRAGLAPSVLDAMISRNRPPMNEDVVETKEAAPQPRESVAKVEESAIDFNALAGELRRLLAGRREAERPETERPEAAPELAERQRAEERAREEERRREEKRQRAEQVRRERRRAAVALEGKVFQVQEMVEEVARTGTVERVRKARVWTRLFNDLAGGRNIADTTERVARDRERLRGETQSLVSRTRRALVQVYLESGDAGLDEVAADLRRAGMCLDAHDGQGGRLALRECLRGNRPVLEEHARAAAGRAEASDDELLNLAVERLADRPKQMRKAALANLQDAVRSAWLRLRTEY